MLYNKICMCISYPRRPKPMQKNERVRDRETCCRCRLEWVVIVIFKINLKRKVAQLWGQRPRDLKMIRREEQRPFLLLAAWRLGRGPHYAHTHTVYYITSTAVSRRRIQKMHTGWFTSDSLLESGVSLRCWCLPTIS